MNCVNVLRFKHHSLNLHPIYFVLNKDFMDTLTFVLLRDMNGSTLEPLVIQFPEQRIGSPVRLFLYLIKRHGVKTRGVVTGFRYFNLGIGWR
jgi:hypothetical protein